MTLWELRQYTEQAIPAWVIIAAPVLVVFIGGFINFTRGRK